MKLSVVRGGGVAGTVVKTELASDDLSPEDAGTLHKLVQDAGLLEEGEREQPPSRPDELSYGLTVEHAGHSHTVNLTESTMPEAVRSLIAWSGSVPGGRTGIEPPGPPAG
jgi:hypothetical protein